MKQILIALILVTGIIYLRMPPLNPANTEFAEIIKGLQQDVQRLSVTTQPSFSQWLSYNPSQFVYSSDNNATVSADIYAQLSIGNPVRIAQGAGYKYFYIVGKTLASGIYTITFSGGSDYTFDNTSFTDIAISSLANPTGFPSSFTSTPVFAYLNITGGNATNKVGEFFFIGSHLVYRGSADISWTASAPGPEIDLTAPFDMTSLPSFVGSGSRPYMAASFSNYIPRIVCQSSTTIGIFGVSAVFTGGGAGSATLYFSITI